MCDEDPTCEHPGSHSEWVRQIMSLALEQAEYEGKNLDPLDLAGTLNRAVKRREKNQRKIQGNDFPPR